MAALTGWPAEGLLEDQPSGSQPQTTPAACTCQQALTTYLLQAEAAGLERELELARRQIDIERRKQEEMVRERER